MKKRTFSMRLPDSTVQRIDAIVDQHRRDNPGLPVSRAGVIAMLLETAIAAWNDTQDRLNRPKPPAG